MVFPQTPLEQVVELLVDGTWTDITSDVRRESTGVNIRRGRSNWSSNVDRSVCQLTLNNRLGKYSPRNPNSQYYGKIGRNAPIRVRLGDLGGAYLEQSGPDSVATAPDSAGLSITGDVDIRIDVELDDWSRGNELAAKYSTSGENRSWVFWLDDFGQLRFRWSPDGTFASLIDVSSTEVVPVTEGRQQLRVTLDVNNGAGGNDVTFYTAPTFAGPWTQLGTTITTTGTTSIANTDAAVEVGVAFGLLAGGGMTGKIYRFQMFATPFGLDERADLDFSNADPNDTSVTTPQGDVFTFDECTIVEPTLRFSGEVSEWPQRWDSTGNDIWTPIEASGILRRLGQGAASLRSAIYRATMGFDPAPVAYWPCEDGSDSTAVASAIPNVGPMLVRASSIGEPDFAAYDGFGGSEPILKLGEASIEGKLPRHQATGVVQFRFLINVPDDGTSHNRTIANLVTTGTIREWRLAYLTGGSIHLLAFDPDGVILLDTTLGVGLDGTDKRLSLELQQDGSDVDWALVWLDAGAATGAFNDGTITGRLIGRAVSVTFNQSNLVGEVAIGHVTIATAITSIFDLHAELVGFEGEVAGRRIIRLCEEEGIPLRVLGNPDNTFAMGPQTARGIVDLLREAANADGGILYEPRDFLGVAYLIREKLYNRTAALTLDYSSADLSGIEPVEDDQALINDVTATRRGGSSVRHIVESGPLSVQPPPDGVGRYDESVTLSLADDTKLTEIAAWRAHLGTVDEPRYPVIDLKLARANFAADAALAGDARALDVGDRLVIDNPPEWVGGTNISQLAQGFSETLSNYAHDIGINCSPEAPWRVGIVEDEVLGKLDTDGSELADALDSTATAFDVVTTEGPGWTTDPAEFPFDIVVGGEVMTVTAIGGGTGTFTEGFESGVTSWVASAGLDPLEQSTDFAHSGSFSLKAIPDSTQASVNVRSDFATSLPTSPGTEHTGSGWVRAGSLSGGIGPNGVRAILRWFDSGGSIIDSTLGPISTLTASVWTEFTVTGTAPANSVRVGISVLANESSMDPADTFYVDDAEITTAPQTFTVTRSANGIIKAHDAGTPVRLAHPLVLSL